MELSAWKVKLNIDGSVTEAKFGIGGVISNEKAGDVQVAMSSQFVTHAAQNKLWTLDSNVVH
ncbi:hypothetical protein FRX31_019834 [Thalictrum thalictroides]|uniref:Uncharacterized protein n=1 Tax=Thalictrum thalictroides TaxID=46969 RepID=A0A7J6W1D9_THATH|nr:hypothetical protein FRX31_019834 [Thalictrum thalictroides]